MSKTRDEIMQEMMQLQPKLVQATMNGDKKKFKEYDIRYNALVKELDCVTFGSNERDPADVITKYICSCLFAQLDNAHIQAPKLTLCDSIYHREGYFEYQRGVDIVGLQYFHENDQVQMVVITTGIKNSQQELQYIGGFSADSGTVLLLNGEITKFEESEGIKKYLYATQRDTVGVHPIEVAQYKGFMMSHGHGSGGYDLYMRSNEIIIDFRRLRNDPEVMRY